MTTTDTTATPCDFPPCEDGGEPCNRHEREWGHSEGDHELCGPECTAAVDDSAVQVLSLAGAMCGECGDEPGERACQDCERFRYQYVADLRAAGWAPRVEAFREGAAYLRAEADRLWAPGKTAHTVMHADATRLDDLAQGGAE